MHAFPPHLGKNNSEKGKISSHAQSISDGKYKSKSKADHGSWQLAIKPHLQTFCMFKEFSISLT